MKTIKAKIVMVIVGLLGSLAFLHLINCNDEPKCCPRIIGFQANPQYICLECPGGNEVELYCRIEFWKEEERCVPPKDFIDTHCYIRNLTDGGSDITNLRWDTSASGSGIYGGSFFPVKVDKDTDFLLVVSGEEGCSVITRKATIRVVKDGDIYTLELKEMPNPEICKLIADTNIFGEGVKLKEVRNKSNFNVYVKHFGPRVYIRKGDSAKDFAGQPANGSWEAEIAEETSDPADRRKCNEFRKLPKDQKKITLELVLTCKCD